MAGENFTDRKEMNQMQFLGYGIVLVMVIWIILVHPYNGRRHRMEELQRWYYAHRGFHDNHGDAPENSLLAFRRAVENGYGIELDVRETSDGQLVVCHDDSLQRVAGIDRKISTMTAREVREVVLFQSKQRVPLFRDVLRVIDGKVPVIVEIKCEDRSRTKELCESVAFFLDSYEGPACIESFSPEVLIWYRKHHALTLRGQLSERFHFAHWYQNLGGWLLSICALNAFTRPDFIAYNHKHAGLVRYQALRWMHAFGAAWTIRSEQELKNASRDFELFIFEGFHPGKMPESASKTGTHDGEKKHMIRKMLMFSGTVQGVGFRYRATYIAQDLKVSGWVKNLYDGRVQMEVQGTPLQIDQMIERLKAERFIEITSVEGYEIPVEEHEYEFKVHYD